MFEPLLHKPGKDGEGAGVVAGGDEVVRYGRRKTVRKLLEPQTFHSTGWSRHDVDVRVNCFSKNHAKRCSSDAQAVNIGLKVRWTMVDETASPLTSTSRGFWTDRPVFGANN